MKRSLNRLIILVIISILAIQCDNIQNALREIRLSATVPDIDKAREAKILMAFFSLDNALPLTSRVLYRKAPGKDGMPAVFSLEVDPSTSTLLISKSHLRTDQHSIWKPATLLPAEEEFELRTALLIGEYGDYPDNPPVSVKVVGDLMAKSGQNFKGQTVSVIALPDGPILSYAEYFTLDGDYPYI